MSYLRAEPMPPEAVDRLFSALMLRYGSPFLDRWRDLDIAVVKDDWGRQLANMRPAAIRYALDNLPEKPPTVIDFRKICNEARIAEPMSALVYNKGPVRGPTPQELEQLRRLARGSREPVVRQRPEPDVEEASC